MRVAVPLMIAMFVSAAAEAHVRITPLESKAGASQTYTVRVPTERKVATRSVELDVPDGVTVLSAAGPTGATYTLKREGDRVMSVTWTMEIPPGEVAQFSFTAQNPAAGEQIVWKVRQWYVDGTSSDWVGPVDSRSPAPITKLAAQ